MNNADEIDINDIFVFSEELPESVGLSNISMNPSMDPKLNAYKEIEEDERDDTPLPSDSDDEFEP